MVDITPYIDSVIFVILNNTYEIILESVIFQNFIQRIQYSHIILHASFFYETDDIDDYYTFEDTHDFLNNIVRLSITEEQKEKMQLFVERFEYVFELINTIKTIEFIDWS